MIHVHTHHLYSTTFHPENHDIVDAVFRYIVDQIKYKKDKIDKYGLIPKEQADKAAAWWAQKLLKKDKKTPVDFPVIGETLMGNLANVLDDITERILGFEKILSSKLQQEVADSIGVFLGTDYDPQGILYDAWKESGYSYYKYDDGIGWFPIKTSMVVYEDKVILMRTTII